MFSLRVVVRGVRALPLAELRRMAALSRRRACRCVGAVAPAWVTLSASMCGLLRHGPSRGRADLSARTPRIAGAPAGSLCRCDDARCCLWKTRPSTFMLPRPMALGLDP